MAQTDRKCAAWVVGLLEVQSNDKVLEIGFGPGVGMELLAQAASGGYVFGIDPSKEMLDQAAAPNARAIESGQVDLRLGSAEALPFEDNSFDKAMAINSLHGWPDAIAGLKKFLVRFGCFGIAELATAEEQWRDVASTRFDRFLLIKRLTFRTSCSIRARPL
jgi:ubiquinone/menaquinone biosynthesis C-methylase UbiE